MVPRLSATRAEISAVFAPTAHPFAKPSPKGWVIYHDHGQSERMIGNRVEELEGFDQRHRMHPGLEYQKPNLTSARASPEVGGWSFFVRNFHSLFKTGFNPTLLDPFGL